MNRQTWQKLTDTILEHFNATITKRDNPESSHTCLTSIIQTLKIHNKIPATNIPALLQIHLHAEGTS
jgi:hypothetical protein